MNLTFEQLKPALHKWARHFQSNKYEHWELINAVWEMGGVQKVEHIQFASARIKYDMIDYMRQQEQIRLKRRDESNGVFIPVKIAINSKISENLELLECIEGRNESYDNLDTEDYFNWITKNMTCQSTLITKLYFLDGFTMREIGKVVGVTESMICLRLRRIAERLKAKFPDASLADYNKRHKYVYERKYNSIRQHEWYLIYRKKQLEKTKEVA